MKTWKQKYQALAAATELRGLRLSQRDNRMAWWLTGQALRMFTCEGEYPSARVEAWRFPDDGILIAQNDCRATNRQVPVDLQWYDSLADACDLYGKLECDHNRRVFHNLLAFSTVPGRCPNPWQRTTDRAKELVERFRANCD